MLNFKKERINRKKLLGKGTFGVVRPYQKTDTDDKWAVKIIRAYTFQEILDSFREIALGFSCDNPYVLPIRGYYIEHDKDREEWEICIKLPRTKEGSLREILTNFKKDKELIPELQIVQYCYEIVCGLEYLHGRGIAHRDIKPDNILFDIETNTIRIADFGIGDLHEGETTHAIADKAGTLLYAAPENRDLNVSLHKKDLFRADLWSLGMVLFELCTQAELREIVLSSTKEKREENLKEKLLKLNEERKYSEKLLGLISGLLRYNPVERMSLKDIKQELFSEYGTEIRYSKEDQGKFFDLNHDLKLRLRQMQREIEAKDARLINIVYHYKQIIARLQKELDEIKKKELIIEDPKQIQQPKKDIQTLTKELEDKWNDLLEFENEKACKMAVKIKDINMITEEKMIVDFIKDLAERYAKGKYAPLEELCLDLSCCDKTNDQILVELGSHIGATLRDLHSLTLDFTGCKKVTDEGLTQLAFYISINLKSLRNLFLEFNLCTMITDQGLKELGSHIGTNLKNLQSLDLNFQGCYSTGDQGLYDLACDIGTNLKNLQHVQLSFRNTGVKEAIKNAALAFFIHVKERKII